MSTQADTSMCLYVVDVVPEFEKIGCDLGVPYYSIVVAICNSSPLKQNNKNWA